MLGKSQGKFTPLLSITEAHDTPLCRFLPVQWTDPRALLRRQPRRSLQLASAVAR